MSDIESVERAKQRADSSAYKKGLREGFDQGVYMCVGVAVALAALIKIFG